MLTAWREGLPCNAIVSARLLLLLLLLLVMMRLMLRVRRAIVTAGLHPTAWHAAEAPGQNHKIGQQQLFTTIVLTPAVYDNEATQPRKA
jgi:hypothetical protein